MLLAGYLDQLNLSLFSSNKDNPAEKFFAEMPVKDGGSYAAMICGLVKVCVMGCSHR